MYRLHRVLILTATLTSALCAHPAAAANLCFEQAGARYVWPKVIRTELQPR